MKNNKQSSTKNKNEERKKLPSALAKMKNIQEVHEYYQKIISCMPNNVYWLDSNCITQGCNNNVLKFVGLKTLDEFVGLTYEKMGEIAGWTEGHAAIYKKDDIEVMLTGTPKLNVEDPPVHDANGNTTYYLTSRMPVFDEKQKIIGVVGISVDITDRKKIEEDLKLAKEAAEASAQSKAAFIANMSHDLRTPLTGIIGLSTMIEDSAHNADERQNAQWIHDSGEQLLILLNGILDVVSADNLGEDDVHNISFDLRELIEGIVQLELPTTKIKQLDLRVEIDKNAPAYIISDRTKLHRVLLNLLGNAIKFTKTGSITIEVKCLDNTAGDVHLQFGVADTGIGIPLGLQGKVFDRFYRVTPSYKGTYTGHGVGLDIAQSYVKLLGGHITLTSQEGIGTTFHFDLTCKIGSINDTVTEETVLPFIEIKAPQCNKPPTLTPIVDTIARYGASKNTNAPNILLIEDSLIALKIIESLVRATGCRFESAVDGEHALKLATTNKFDLVLADIGLPGISGNEFTRQFREWEKAHHKKPTPIIGLTAHVRKMAIKECLQCGMDDVFCKPANLDMIQSILKNHVVFNNQTEIKNTGPHDEPYLPAGVGKLGPDLPDTEDELFAMDAFLIFSPGDALEQVGDETMLFELLDTFISDKIQQDVHEMTSAYEKKNWGAVENLAHKLKGGAGYLGIHRMFYACQYLERYYKAGHRDLNLLDKLYHQIIKVNQDTIKTVEDWLNLNKTD